MPIIAPPKALSCHPIVEFYVTPPTPNVLQCDRCFDNIESIAHHQRWFWRRHFTFLVFSPFRMCMYFILSLSLCPYFLNFPPYILLFPRTYRLSKNSNDGDDKYVYHFHVAFTYFLISLFIQFYQFITHHSSDHVSKLYYILRCCWKDVDIRYKHLSFFVWVYLLA